MRRWLLAGLLLCSLASSQAAERIVSLAPFLTDTVVSLHAEDRLVGVVNDDYLPERLSHLARIGGYRSLSLERILAQKPDLVLGWTSGNDPQALRLLQSWGIRVVQFDPQDLQQVADTVLQLGRELDTQAQAEQLVETYQGELRRLQRPLTANAPRVFLQVWNDPMYTLSGTQMVSHALSHCGAVNVFQDLPGLAPQVSREGVLAADPDMIVVLGDSNQQPGVWRDQWLKYPQLKAVANQQVHVLDSTHLVRPTPDLVKGLAALCELMQ